ncbi:DUF2855 family protein [Salicola sp. Rm-C-2C1-2]|uniref:DUF2855 family protein n=1 Tax=Salicola sp. Rm-C-2C1-2 TaxID=3141321 RepID=UPI0032E41E6A
MTRGLLLPTDEGATMTVSSNTTFVVNRNNLHEHTILERDPIHPEDLADGDVLLAVDRFSFTANNITYAALGDAFHYWDFFPVEQPWGQIPVWGFADVTASKHPEVTEGTRVYGYLPMARQLRVQPGRLSKSGFTDVAPHRENLAAIYNQYVFTANDPAYRPEHEAFQMLLRPLLVTSFLLDDFIAQQDCFGADQIILTSASSKTALGLAFMLNHQRESRGQPKVLTALTSSGNVEFVRGLGYYDRVISYDELETLDASEASVSVDFAGNGQVLQRLHEHFGDQLQFSSLVGASHWDQRGGGKGLPGPKPELFFAPKYWEQAAEAYGTAALMQRFADLWAPLVASMEGWMTISEVRGAEAVAEAYEDTLAGRVSPGKGLILTLAR